MLPLLMFEEEAKVNNEPSGFFKPTRGLRQGDPLSPYLFLICMDVLAKRLALQALNSKSGIGIKLAPRADRIPCLFFADDSLLFCKATAQTAYHLKSILEVFCHQSGQLINLHKSLIVFSKNTPSLDKQHVQGVLNIPTSSALGKYLGCASFQGRPSSDIFDNLAVRAQSKLATWKANSLSKAGRAILIQSNLEALPTHTM